MPTVFVIKVADFDTHTDSKGKTVQQFGEFETK